MTYRERREKRAERLREWADSAEEKADAAHERVHEIADRIPFGQPILVGHHSEGRARRDQARIESGMRASVDESRKATRHEERAENIERQLRESVYDDDEDAVEQLEARIRQREERRDEMKSRNVAYRKEHAAELRAMGPYERSQAVPFPSYALTNLGASIRKDRERLERLRREASPDFEEAPRMMSARFASTCPGCGEEIERGETILYYKRQRRAIHAACGREAEMERCAICGETIREGEAAEMYDPKLHDDDFWSETEAGIVHAECGLQAGWEVA